jgi:hypothetical protein
VSTSPALDWRKVVINFDDATGEVVVRYGMPRGVPDEQRYPWKDFLANDSASVRLILYHVMP